MPTLLRYTVVVLGLAAGSASYNSVVAEGRWVIGGAFATSGYQSSQIRHNKSYRGADREEYRVATYLPGMTILYAAADVEVPGLGYQAIRAVTQTGIPIVVRKDDVSESDFAKRDFSDVLFHRSFSACSAPNCEDWQKTPIGIGEGFKKLRSIDVSSSSILYTLENSDEVSIVLTARQLHDLEEQGVLTQHFERNYPRFEISEGYASKLSLGCGETTESGQRIIGSRPQEAQASNDYVSFFWDIKAAELFGLGELLETESGATLVDDEGNVTLSIREGYGSKSATEAMDITVFKVHDRTEDTDSYGAIRADVLCKKSSSFGRAVPGTVKTAFFVFKGIEVELPQQLTEAGKQGLTRHLRNRSFLYSINEANQYFDFFEKLALSVGNNHIAAFLVSRLNASCSEERRGLCFQIARVHAVQDQAVVD